MRSFYPQRIMRFHFLSLQSVGAVPFLKNLGIASRYTAPMKYSLRSLVIVAIRARDCRLSQSASRWAPERLAWHSLVKGAPMKVSIRSLFLVAAIGLTLDFGIASPRALARPVRAYIMAR